MKKSKQRDTILRIVQDNCNHPDAYTVHGFAKKEIPNISLGTVYRNLNLLAELNEIKKITVPNDNDRFDKTVCNHSHFKCVKCSSVTDIDFDLAINDIEKSNNCIVLTHDIVLIGICDDCLKKEG